MARKNGQHGQQPMPSKSASSGDQLEPFQRARSSASPPPAAVKSPAAYSAGPSPASKTARASTPPSTPGSPPNVRTQPEWHAEGAASTSVSTMGEGENVTGML